MSLGQHEDDLHDRTVLFRRQHRDLTLVTERLGRTTEAIADDF
jgi:hypothetical protein